ncbi:MAG: phosphatidylglycerophosphatase A [Gammaproteobacteria bacterium]|nr:MAG: phosphatidylglycerophosphatase A [Gammaproteobacteria bacterium]
MRPDWREVLRDPVQWLGTGLFSGLVPKAPGTAGSAAGLLVWVLVLDERALPVQLGVIFVSLLAGVWICAHTSRCWGVHDHGAIVWDEWVGQWIACLILPAFGGLEWLFAFVLFRYFDIRKPWPVSWLDRNLGGGWGIMLDDVAAGLMALAVSLWFVWWLP